MSELDVTVDKQAPTPLWEQVADALRARILDGRIPPSHKMPTEADLAHHLGIGGSTVVRSIAHLRREGLVIWVPGRGTFSAPADVIRRHAAPSRSSRSARH